MQLRHLQRLLQGLYNIQVELKVDDFLLTDPELVAQLDTSFQARQCEEKLLVLEEDGQLNLSLFINSVVLERLSADNPCTTLHDANLADFCTALEGVSHFLYLTHRALQDRPVTLLELELQAEVDKYVSVHAIVTAQGAALAPRVLLRRLFQDVRYDEQLAVTELLRYGHANDYASHYCHHLETSFLGLQSPDALHQEIRIFYELNQQEKIRRIDAAKC
ncbi:MAG: hypothetical protein HOI95_03455 [Chromatiales bacterium]|nr:hypothetical protein [Chromatiales bacterium]